MINPKLPAVWYGGDYNPDQWPEDVWHEDMRLMRAAGVNVVTLPVFSWVALQPDEETFTFEWLDRILDLLEENGIALCLATSTAAQPAWLSRKYPDVLPVGQDGVRRKHGGRQNYCPNSPDFRRLSRNLARALAERYGTRPGLVMWHVSNEYGPECFCETCAAAFRDWLRARYGSLEELNRRWYTAFWSHTYTDWGQIETPTDNGERSIPAMLLDYQRFMSDSVLACYRGEVEEIRAASPDVPITTNLMGTYKTLDYDLWAQEMDVVSWDSYPRPLDPPWIAAFRHDLMRGLKGGQPFLLMEQTPDQVNWQGANSLKPPGVMRLQSYQAMAHGADAVMFFQWRRGWGGYEKFHGAFVAHEGSEETRTFRECADLGAELSCLGDAFLGAQVPARVAILFDWQAWWALEFSMGPTDQLRYVDQAVKWYEALWRMNVPVEVVNPARDLSRFDVVIVPTLYALRPGVAKNLGDVVQRGGTMVASLFTGIADENDRAFLGGYPGPLRQLFGLWNEEIDPMQLGAEQGVRFEDGARYACSVAVERIHPEGADVLATFTDGWHKGEPAVTRNRFGDGEAYYVATDMDRAGRDALLQSVLATHNIAPRPAPEGVEIVPRVKDGRTVTFVLNHTAEPVYLGLRAPARDLLTGADVSGVTEFPGYGVWVVSSTD